MHAFGVHVIATPPSSNLPVDESYVQFLPLDELLPLANIVTLHVNLTEQNYRINPTIPQSNTKSHEASEERFRLHLRCVWRSC